MAYLDSLLRLGNAQHGVWVAERAKQGPWLACQLKLWMHAFIANHNSLPQNHYGWWNTSLLEDKDLEQDIHLHLQGIGKFVKAMDIVDYLETLKMKVGLKLKKNISLTMAQWWMHVMDYQWLKEPKGQFLDGHEREVVTCRQEVLLPTWEKLELTLHQWGDVNLDKLLAKPMTHHNIVWHHDKLMFYANDRCKIWWVHKGENAVLHAKGEGVSLMVTDFVSADYGWL